MWAILTSKAGLAVIAVALVLGVIGVQSARLAHAKADLAQARTALAASMAAIKLSEDKRAVEYSQAVSDLSSAETQCATRVQAALKAGGKIHAVVSKPVTFDASHCPLRQLVGADELRDALKP